MVLAQLGPGELRMAGLEERMAAAAIQQHGLAKQLLVDQALRAAVRRDDADLEVALEHALLDRVDRTHVHRQADLGRHLGEARDRLADARLRIGRGLVEQRHLELAAHAVVDVVDAAAEGIDRSQQPQRLVVDALALGREREAGPAAPAQHQAEPGLEVLHVAAHRRGADVELELGRRHAAAVDHALEHLEQAQVHVAELAQHGTAAGRGGAFFYLHGSSSEH
jgi:hypothetical protein